MISRAQMPQAARAPRQPVLADLASDSAASFAVPPVDNCGAEAVVRASILALTSADRLSVSASCAAGSSTQARTHNMVARLLGVSDLAPAAHVTCVDPKRDAIANNAQASWQATGRSSVAFRGDPAQQERFAGRSEGSACAAERVFALMRIVDRELAVARSETHPEAARPSADSGTFKRTLGGGARRAGARFLFNPNGLFRDRAAAVGISAERVSPIPLASGFAQPAGMPAGCAPFSAWFARMFDGLEEKPPTRQPVAAAAAASCRPLHAGAVGAFHCYTPDPAQPSDAIGHPLGLHSQAAKSIQENAA